MEWIGAPIRTRRDDRNGSACTSKALPARNGDSTPSLAYDLASVKELFSDYLSRVASVVVLSQSGRSDVALWGTSFFVFRVFSLALWCGIDESTFGAGHEESDL